MDRISRRIYDSSDIKLGLVIGTYAAIPYIHLGLESRQRNYWHTPVLVHDDSSSSEPELLSLCERYGAEFSANETRLGHFLGDLVVFKRGLEWASENNLDLVVKFSRRFIPLFDWTVALKDIAWISQYATFSNVAMGNGMGFRTECTALHVRSWFASGAYDLICRQVETGKIEFVEGFVHQISKRVHRSSCAENRRYEILHPKPPDLASYCDWPIMGKDRMRHLPNLLWRFSCSPEEYARAAKQYGVNDYSMADFDEVEGAQSKFVPPSRRAVRRTDSKITIED